MLKKSVFFVLIWVMFSSICKSEGDGTGEVLLVLGSDTAIWDGMGTATFIDHYNPQLFTSPSFNAYKVMNASWRQKMKDSYGNTVKFTWWMMAGNIYRYADNINMPYPNTMCLYYMKKYHGDAIKQLGDELSLHYHTFAWTDYNADGIYYWNQAHSFWECKEDFDYTLAQYLLEENIYPVSFRSGWHYMDNNWQNYLDELLLFSMDDDYPAKRFVTNEPIDNNYDWSQSSRYFVPFHPSKTNYQLPGTCRGWNLRSRYASSFSADLMNQMFSEANKGSNQIACIWAHLPEDTFLTNMENVDTLAHFYAKLYPNVKFRYCTAVEAMQRYLKSTDSKAPQISFTENNTGNNVTFEIKTDEPIFQPQPFVAIKDIYERFIIAPCKLTSANTWITTQSYPKNILAKAGVALTDTVGNVSTAFINYLPDDIYVDDKDAGCTEVKGAWISVDSSAYWNCGLKKSIVAAGDSVIIDFKPVITKSCTYNVFYQTPSFSAPITRYTFLLYKNNLPADTIVVNNSITGWKRFKIFTKFLEPGSFIRVIYKNTTSANATAFADVMKFSPLVPDKQISYPSAIINLGTFIELDSLYSYKLKLSNGGTENLTIKNISSSLGQIKTDRIMPLTVLPNGEVEVTIKSAVTAIGKYSDTLLILSDDPVNPTLKISCYFEVSAYYELVDNEDLLKYTESGKWNFSNAYSIGATSRYSSLSDGAGAYAIFKTTLKKSGTYQFYEIVPKTENAATKAYYEISIGGKVLASTYLNQNDSSGYWIPFAKAFINAGSNVEVKVLNDGSSGTASGSVLRADAVKALFINSVNGVENTKTKPFEYTLEQNYPNPFNPATLIRFQIAQNGNTNVSVYDILGRKIATLIDEYMNAGSYQITFNAAQYSSGMYIVKLQSGSFSSARKILLLK